METAREEGDDKRSWGMFRGDLVREIARIALRKDRGPRQVDNSESIGIFDSWPCGGSPVERGRGWSSWDVRKDLGCTIGAGTNSETRQWSG